MEIENWNWKIKLKIAIENWNWNWNRKVNLDTVFISENTRVPRKKEMFATYQVDWFARLFCYNLPLYDNLHILYII